MNSDPSDNGSGERSGEAPQAPRVLHAFDPGPSVAAAADALEALKTPFVLIGGLALDAWGMPRATKDVDFAVPVGAAEKVAKAFDTEDCDVRPLRTGGIGIRSPTRNLRIDFIDRRFHFGRLYREAIDEAHTANRQVQSNQRAVPLVSLEHLLAMKMVSGAPKDDADVRRILQLEDLDYACAQRITETHLGPASANRLDEFARETGRPEVPRRRLYRNGDDFDEA